MSGKIVASDSEFLGFIDSFATQWGFPPTYREMMEALGYKTLSAVFR